MEEKAHQPSTNEPSQMGGKINVIVDKNRYQIDDSDEHKKDINKYSSSQ